LRNLRRRFLFFFSSRRRHTRFSRDWSSDVCSSDLLRLAQELNNTDYDVLLLDKHNYHQFQPLMYQVATARLEPTSISFPLRKVFQKSKNFRIGIEEVLRVDAENKII